jgi:hypothetical protein
MKAVGSSELRVFCLCIHRFGYPNRVLFGLMRLQDLETLLPYGLENYVFEN